MALTTQSPSIAKGKEEVEIYLYTPSGLLEGEFSFYRKSYDRILYITLHHDKIMRTLFAMYIYVPHSIYDLNIKTFTF
jgi:hypothetical protein